MKLYQKKMHQHQIQHPWDPRYHFHQWLYGPLAHLKKGVLDTFKPYKTTHQRWRDIVQPLKGMNTLFYGYTAWLLTPLPLLALPFMMATKWIKRNDPNSRFNEISYSRMSKAALTWSLFVIAISVVHILKGSLEFFLTPLTWFIRIPLRTILTLSSKPPRIEESIGISVLANEMHAQAEALKNTPVLGVEMELATKIIITAQVLLEKYKKASDRHQATAISLNEHVKVADGTELALNTDHESKQLYVGDTSDDSWKRAINAIRFFHFHTHKPDPAKAPPNNIPKQR